jgi:hypothetical protein
MRGVLSDGLQRQLHKGGRPDVLSKVRHAEADELAKMDLDGKDSSFDPSFKVVQILWIHDSKVRHFLQGM